MLRGCDGSELDLEIPIQDQSPIIEYVSKSSFLAGTINESLADDGDIEINTRDKARSMAVRRVAVPLRKTFGQLFGKS